MNNEKEREAFEKWCVKNNPLADITRLNENTYCDGWTAAEWQGWKAGCAWKDAEHIKLSDWNRFGSASPGFNDVGTKLQEIYEQGNRTALTVSDVYYLCRWYMHEVLHQKSNVHDAIRDGKEKLGKHKKTQIPYLSRLRMQLLLESY